MRFITIVEVIRCTPGKGAEFLIAQRLVGGQVGGGDADQVIGVAEQPFGVAKACRRQWPSCARTRCRVTV